ncbi:MAG: hypothetical protein ABL974_09610 [Prosthecobacter sp.]
MCQISEQKTHQKLTANRGSKYSALFTSQPFAEYRRYDVRVTAAEMKNAIHAMRARFPETAAVSGNIADLRLIHFNLNPEIFAPKGSRGRLGLALRNIRVELVPR